MKSIANSNLISMLFLVFSFELMANISFASESTEFSEINSWSDVKPLEAVDIKRYSLI